MSSQIEIAEGLSQHLGPPATPKLELYTEFLDSGRFSGADYVDRLADTLAAKYGALPPHIVVTVGPDALRFMLDHRNRIAPTATLVFGDMSERSLKRLAPPQDVRGVVVAYDVSKTIDLAATLQPEAERIVVISGSAEFDRYWQESARQKLGDRYRDLPVEYLSGLTLDAFVSESRKLSPQTILLLLTIFEDAGGVKYRPRDAVSKIAEASAAPSYGVLGSYVGSGILGGYTATYRSIGKDIAASIAKLLSGDQSDPGIVHANSRPVVDWRQLRRWGIKESRLPVDVDLHYYTPTHVGSVSLADRARGSRTAGADFGNTRAVLRAPPPGGRGDYSRAIGCSKSSTSTSPPRPVHCPRRSRTSSTSRSAPSATTRRRPRSCCVATSRTST